MKKKKQLESHRGTGNETFQFGFQFFSVRELLKMGIQELPTTRAGLYQRIKKEGWPSRIRGGQGGRAGGMKEFAPPKDVLALILRTKKEWSGTAEGPAKYFYPAERWDDAATAVRLQEIDQALKAVGEMPIPLTPAWLSEYPECAEYKEELKRIALGAEAGPDQKARADWLLSKIYDDQEASARRRERDRQIRERSESAAMIITRAGMELGYDAPMVWTLLIHELIEWHGLDEAGTRRILETLRNTSPRG